MSQPGSAHASIILCWLPSRDVGCWIKVSQISGQGVGWLSPCSHKLRGFNFDQATGAGIQGPFTIQSSSLFLLVLVLAQVRAFLVALATEPQKLRIRQWLYHLLRLDLALKAKVIGRTTDH